MTKSVLLIEDDVELLKARQAPADGESESGAPEPTRRRRVGLNETVEDRLQPVLRNTDTRGIAVCTGPRHERTIRLVAHLGP